MSLIAHADTKRVTEVEVLSVPEPEFTRTWHPVSHEKVITALDVSCKEMGIGIVDRQYSMNEKGTKMFGTWQLDISPDGKTGYELGFRNSIDKSMVLGICAGTHVFVCDNLCFSGEFITFRKHTGTLTYAELFEIANGSVVNAVDKMRELLDWQIGLRDHYVPKEDMKCLVFDMVQRDVISGGKINNYLSCLEEEKKIINGHVLDGATSLYNMHGAATRLMRGWSLLQASEATGKLNNLCDDYLIQIAA